MKTYSIHLPRQMLSKAMASWFTNWKMGPEQATKDHLDELWGANDAKFALELVKEGQLLHYCYSVGKEDDDAITAMIHSIEPGVETIEIPDPSKTSKQIAYASVAQISLKKPNVLPLDTYMKVAGCASMVACALSVIPAHRRAIVQYVLRRRRDSFYLQAKFFIQKIYWLISILWQPRYWFKIYALKNALSLIEERRKERLYDISIRVAVIEERDPVFSKKGETPEEPEKIQAALDQHVKNLFYVLSWHNRLHCNKIKLSKIQHGINSLIPLQERSLKGSFLLGTTEITAFWHVPKHVFLQYVPIVFCPQGSPPKDLPTDLNNSQTAFIGKSLFRDKTMVFGINKSDRARHTLIVGKTGTGKSSLLKLFIKADIDSGSGLAVLDPDGSLADDCLKMIPKSRVKDVVVFDLSDENTVPLFNPLVGVQKELALEFASNLASLLTVSVEEKKRKSVNTLLIFLLKDLLVEKDASLQTLRDNLINKRYGTSDSQLNTDAEIVKSLDVHRTLILRLLSDLMAHPNSLRMFGQSKNNYDFHNILKEKKILIAKLPTKILGSKITSFVGGLLAYKLNEVIMAQAAKKSAERYDFSLFTDSAKFFATEALETMLNESRKYGLSMTLTTQYLRQIEERTRRSLLANVGNIFTFRTTHEDATIFSQEFKSRFTDDNMMNLPDRRCYIKMMIAGQVQEPFSAITLDCPKLPEKNYAAHCRKFSAGIYSFAPKIRQISQNTPVTTQEI